MPLLRAAPRRPNFVVIFLDDAGYGDFHPFGQPDYPTANVARLAAQGCRFTNFYVPQAVCSASRSALLSGCYPGRTGVFGAHGPGARGLDPKFATIGEVFRRAGYRTASFGKWHIGDQEDTRPPARGFDESCGLMYSNDMWEHHPENPENWASHPLRFWENGEVRIERVTHDDQRNLTRWYTEHSVDFIARHKKSPFFLYVPHSMPHVPLHCSPRFEGKTGLGLYADVMQEIDWSVGEIAGALRKAGVENDTVVMFTSDNGPWSSYGNHAGRTPFRDAKGTGFDGGTRSPCIVRYPKAIRAGTVSGKAWCSIDVLPTFARLADAKLPENPIDGRDVWDLVRGAPGAANPHEFYAFGTNNVFEGVISGDGKWKLHVPHPYRTLVSVGNDGQAGKYRQERIGLSLFDLEKDPYETVNVLGQQPEVAARMLGFAERHRKEFYPNQAPATAD